MRTTPSASARFTRLRDERGAVLVHVAVAFTGLLAFSALSIDLGVVWAARRQAQNAADAAALAGAITLSADPTGGQPNAEIAAKAIANTHVIWDEAITNSNITFVCPPGVPAGGACIQAEVGRDGVLGTPLPIYIAQLFGGPALQVKAFATAQVFTGNASNCLQPWVIPDRWLESTGIWNVTSTFVSPGDTYVPPSPSGPGTGYRVDDPQTGVGASVQFQYQRLSDTATITAGTFLAMDLPRLNGAGMSTEDRELANITSCNNMQVAIGEEYDAFDHNRELTQAAGQDLIARDPDAYWDPLTRIVRSPRGVSPRVVAVATYNPYELWLQPRPGPSLRFRITNIVGFFIEESRDGAFFGRIVSLGGSYTQASELLTAESSYLRSVTLVR